MLDRGRALIQTGSVWPTSSTHQWYTIVRGLIVTRKLTGTSPRSQATLNVVWCLTGHRPAETGPLRSPLVAEGGGWDLNVGGLRRGPKNCFDETTAKHHTTACSHAFCATFLIFAYFPSCDIWRRDNVIVQRTGTCGPQEISLGDLRLLSVTYRGSIELTYPSGTLV